jgi:hypothetical protein
MEKFKPIHCPYLRNCGKHGSPPKKIESGLFVRTKNLKDFMLWTMVCKECYQEAEENNSKFSFVAVIEFDDRAIKLWNKMQDALELKIKEGTS